MLNAQYIHSIGITTYILTHVEKYYITPTCISCLTKSLRTVPCGKSIVSSLVFDNAYQGVKHKSM